MLINVNDNDIYLGCYSYAVPLGKARQKSGFIYAIGPSSNPGPRARDQSTSHGDIPKLHWDLGL